MAGLCQFEKTCARLIRAEAICLADLDLLIHLPAQSVEGLAMRPEGRVQQRVLRLNLLVGRDHRGRERGERGNSDASDGHGGGQASEAGDERSETAPGSTAPASRRFRILLQALAGLTEAGEVGGIGFGLNRLQVGFDLLESNLRQVLELDEDLDDVRAG